MKPFTFLALMALSLSVFTGCTHSQEQVTPQPAQARSTAGARLSVPRIVRDLVIREYSTGAIVGNAEEATYYPQSGYLTFTTAQGSFNVFTIKTAQGYTITDGGLTIKKTSFTFLYGPTIYDSLPGGGFMQTEADFYSFGQ